VTICSLIKIQGFSSSIQYSWGLLAFYNNYRFPLLSLPKILGLSLSTTEISPSILCSFLVSDDRLADFFWMTKVGLLSIQVSSTSLAFTTIQESSNFVVLPDESTLFKLKLLGFSEIADKLTKSIEIIENYLGISEMDTLERDDFLQKYGLCAKGNPSVLDCQVKSIDSPSKLFNRVKLQTVRDGDFPIQSRVKELVAHVLRKKNSLITYNDIPLYKRVMPSVGMLCSVEALIISPEDFLLYDSTNNLFFNIDLSDLEKSIIYSDIWLNLGKVDSGPCSAIFLFSKQVPIKIKYGKLTEPLQYMETGIVLADLWSSMNSFGLCGCILGNPMSGCLTRCLNTYHLSVIPTAALILFAQ
jgi:hypothetical protein